MCSDDPETIIIKTDAVNRISDLQLNDGVGSVMIEAGATFPDVYVKHSVLVSLVFMVSQGSMAT